ncbi:hypothetical protein GXW74_00005 [Roseomonas eburnea]|uniref:Uncharacterized protein n=1 Tax=Neoroseomonas eburnea TaxID=1346889 RepID=A0A9X9X572_9PROT|nr:hypothetical protein [Neoroseomonas eburnea]MBR0678858.1 hypothetical protein [Neoroseomonas eburnea]
MPLGSHPGAGVPRWIGGFTLIPGPSRGGAGWRGGVTGGRGDCAAWDGRDAAGGSGSAVTGGGAGGGGGGRTATGGAAGG